MVKSKKVLVMSDIHGNITALRAVVKDAPSFDEIWIAGDFIDYGVHNTEVIDYIVELADTYKISAVLGNHEELLLKGDNSYYKPKKEYSKRSSELTRNLLSPSEIEYLGSKIDLEMKEESRIILGSILMIHDENRLPYQWIFEKVEMWSMPGMTPMTLIAGHNHLPYDKIKSIKGVNLRIINPGSVGQPRNGNPNASYAIITLKNKEVDNVELRNVTYNTGFEALSIKKAGGHPFIANRLKIGV